MASFLTFIACFVAACGISSCVIILDRSTIKPRLFEDLYSGPKSEKELRRHIFLNYDKMARPVKNWNDSINVSLGITPLSIRTLDEKNQVIVLETFTIMKWQDDYLKWNPNHFGNITLLRVPSTEVWRPDFALYTATDASDMFPVPNTNALIYNTGTVLWVPMFTVKSRCPITKSSKKVITCNIKIGSWTFPQPQLDIQLAVEKVDLSHFIDANHHWKLMGITQSREAKYYPCCEEAYPVYHFNVTIRRRSEQFSYFKDDDTFQEVIINDM